ncbi:IkappaB kinase complex, IKAP component [Cylindrobasidium torrendii FP15055 ss-10]|uniref:Elongator complex protein 1 n=1 Tax=Cylindrobasidium torrendii FP15055 ss-10 TaxID=1314674 RepID=A0A0D7BJJ9_9AGAR|nr:IkappaB kinase complex, IKAP component [Cylindrobasidium torrendii FP15055 ss-10]
MRNLALAATRHVSISEGEHVSFSTTDLDQNLEYVASETVKEGEVNVKIYTLAADEEPTVFTSFSTIASAGVLNQVISMHVLLDTQQLVAILRSGDITVIELEDGTSDVVGTVDGGILAASWSPDDSVLSLVSGEDKLLLMTTTFDVLSEASLHPDEFGEDAPINVGWGSKQTQFHGSIGKSAATATVTSTHTISPDDDRVPRITWRGDGTYFAVSAVSVKDNHRKFRVYDRHGVLQSTSESVPGLEHPLSWRPSGNLIAATQRFGYPGGGAGKAERHDIVFFERNGLRHGEFSIRVADLGSLKVANSQWGYRVMDLRWSADSNVLAVWIRKEDDTDFVQLWTIGNYHWYLKHEVASVHGIFTSVGWHPEKPLVLILTTANEIIHRAYAWETCSSPSAPPHDSGSVSVTDGTSLLLTPFRTQNVPPPMSSHQLSVSQPDLPTNRSKIPIHTAFAPNKDVLVVLWEHGLVETWQLDTRLGPGRGKIMNPTRVSHWDLLPLPHISYRQVVVLKDSAMAFLGSSKAGSDVLLVVPFGKTSECSGGHLKIDLPERNGHLIASQEVVIWQSRSGGLFAVDQSTKSIESTGLFPGACWTAKHLEQQQLHVGLADSGKLYVSASTKEPAVIASNATSFTVASGFLVYTTGAHESVYAPLSASEGLHAFLEAATDADRDTIRAKWEKRRVERGSRIVVGVPSAMSLVLQMPRGNLETINPRPFVMEVVRQDLDSLQYRKAFMACRKHRIDLNVIVEHDRDAFLKHVGEFVDQVHEVDHINLFLTSVGRSTLNAADIAIVCDSVRGVLEKRDMKTYVNSILTAHVVKTPPDHEAGLNLLLELRDGNPALVEDAVKYIIFLVDAERLYDTALGMYDFSLVLLIAQHSQKDPREYLPFLRRLRAMETYVQRFTIDDHLKRYPSALKNLHLAGDEHFDQAIEYIERYSLYEAGLRIWKNTPRYQAVLTTYGDWLFDRREFRQAASVFIEAGALQRAMVAHEKALEWQGFFDLAIRTNMGADDLKAAGYRVAEDLSAKKRYQDAARVLLDYADDVREAVVTLTHGNAFSEARRIATLKRQGDLLDEVIKPAALESRGQLSEDINEMREQLEKQYHRLLELKVRRVEEPDAFFGLDGEGAAGLADVDVMTDASMPFTAFTRYTVAPTSVSKVSSKRTSKSKRKQERKVGSGRKGTVDEEDYLVKSVAKLVTRFSGTRDEARALIPHLFELSDEHREEGLALQKEIQTFEGLIKQRVEEIWKKTDEDEPVHDSWKSRMDAAEKARSRNPVESVTKPEVGVEEWKLRLLDLELGA